MPPPLIRRGARGRPRRAGSWGAALALAASLAAAAPAAAGVGNTSHDMRPIVQDPFSGSCDFCHIPHGAQGERLWVQTTAGPATGWGSRTVAQLCYTCHESGGGGYGASDMTIHAYSPLAHGFDVAAMPPAPDGSPGVPAELPYVATGLLDCTTCHDPHSNNAPFLKVGTIEELCRMCHGRDNPGLLGVENSFPPPGGGEPYSLHPTDVPFEDFPANGPTALKAFPAELQVPTAAAAWRLGGHRLGWQEGAGAIGCQTCHPVHGWGSHPEGRMPGPPASDLTAIENRGAPASLLCEACHAGGLGGGTVGEGDDHPVDTNDGFPPTVFPPGWPGGPAQEVTCSSCHDAHGGAGGTALLRTGGAAEWCWSCHERSAVIPDYHHSTQGNDQPPEFASVLTCADCHGAGAGWTAHNGFTAFKAPEAPDRSALCEICHVAGNPLAFDPEAYLAATGLARTFEGAVQPALHGAPAETSSHRIDAPDSNRLQNCSIRLEPWPSTGLVSKYGEGGEVICESCHAIADNAGRLIGTGPTERLTGGWRANLLLEPYEDNSPGIGVEVPDVFPGPTLSGLCRGCHFSQLTGTDSTFVHNPEAHTVDPYVYPMEFAPYGRVTLGLMTEPNDPASEQCPEISSADAAGAPGRYSYPMPNRLDCDSCHRPHGADTDSEDDGIYRILEYTAPAMHGTLPCLSCHDTDIQCND